MSHDMDLSSYKDLYISEAREYLSQISELLLSLERMPDNKDIIREIYRLMHSLKGSSATMGYSSIELLAHEAENLLSLVRDGKIQVNSDLIDLLLSVVDSLNDAVNQVAEGMDPSIPDELLNQIRKLTSTEQRVKSSRKAKKTLEEKTASLSGAKENQKQRKRCEACVSAEKPETLEPPKELLELPSLEKDKVKELALCGYKLFHVNVIFSSD